VAAGVIVGVDPEPGNAGLITDWAKEYWQELHPTSAGGVEARPPRPKPDAALTVANSRREECVDLTRCCQADEL
jgi:hypothetical protein